MTSRIVRALILVILAAPASVSARCTAIVGARVFLPAGPAEGITVIVDGEAIRAVGPALAVPEGCTRIDGASLVVTAGLIETSSQLGLVEIDLEPSTKDHVSRLPDTSVVNRRLHPAFRVADAYNPRTTLVPVTRIAGVTSTISTPTGGVISGISAWVDLAGGTQREAVRRSEVAVHATIGGWDGSRASRLADIREALLETRRWAAKKPEWERGATRPFGRSLADLQALTGVLAKTVPLVLAAHRASDIEAALRLATELDIRIVIRGGAEAWLQAKALAQAKVGVIIDPLTTLPSHFGSIRARPDNAALLARAGVPVMLSTFWTHNARTLAQVAGNAVREGMPHTAAIRALTQTPAEVFGMPRHGRIAKGARANLVVWSGDPLELSTDVRHVFIGGRSIPLISRQTMLRDRYLRPRVTPAPLTLP